MTETTSELIPENELLAVLRWWRQALVDDSDGQRSIRWGDCGNDPNSVIDAEALSCLLVPHVSLPLFDLSDRQDVKNDVVQALRGSSQSSNNELPESEAALICEMLLSFFERYCHEGAQDFSAGDYAGPATATDEAIAQAHKLEALDSYTFSLSVCIYSQLLVKSWRRGAPKGARFTPMLTKVEEASSKRLTVVLHRLVCAFAVSSYSRTEWEEATGRKWPRNPSTVDELDDIRDQLNALDVSTSADGGLIPPNYAFECGWTWGQLSPDDVLSRDRLPDIDEANRYAGAAFAEKAPYFYFTVAAIDGISDLSLEEIQAADMFDADQLALVSRLRQYLHLSVRYWTAIGFSAESRGMWAVEDIPWRTSDGDESDYYTLYLLGVILSATAEGEQRSALEIDRVIPLLEELAQRARIIRRPIGKDEALKLHAPGKLLSLEDNSGEDDTVVAYWRIYDFAPQLLKLVGRVLTLAKDQSQRDRLRRLANNIWQHLARRRAAPTQVDGVPMSSWDNAGGALRGLPAEEVKYPDRKMKSWYITERTVEALTTVATAERASIPPAPRSSELLQEILSGIEFALAVELPEYLPVSNPEYVALGGRLRRIREEADRFPSKALTRALNLAADVYQKLGEEDD